jgi:hypothetical protein
MDKAFILASTIVLLSACTVTNTEVPAGGGSAPSPTNPAGPSSPSNPPGSSTPAASHVAADVEVDGSCTALAACGGAPTGTWDYTSGCVEDVFAKAREQCAGLDASAVDVRVKGSLFFSAAGLTRDASVTVSGSVVFPSSCALGQCETVESALKAGGFPTASCTGASSCTCAIDRTETTHDATTYTIDGSTVVTGDGERYSYCIEGGSLVYAGRSAGAEVGTWKLARR